MRTESDREGLPPGTGAQRAALCSKARTAGLAAHALELDHGRGRRQQGQCLTQKSDLSIHFRCSPSSSFKEIWQITVTLAFPCPVRGSSKEWQSAGQEVDDTT